MDDKPGLMAAADELVGGAAGSSSIRTWPSSTLPRFNVTLAQFSSFRCSAPDPAAYVLVGWVADHLSERATREVSAVLSTVEAPCLRAGAGDVEVTQLVLTPSNSVLDVLHADLLAAQKAKPGTPLLKDNYGPPHNPLSCDTVHSMVTPAGLAFARSRRDQYAAMSASALKFAPFDGAVGTASGGLTFTFNATAPEVRLLRLTQRKDAGRGGQAMQ